MDDDDVADAEWRASVLEQWEWLRAQPWAAWLWWLEWFI